MATQSPPLPSAEAVTKQSPIVSFLTAAWKTTLSKLDASKDPILANYGKLLLEDFDPNGESKKLADEEVATSLFPVNAHDISTHLRDIITVPAVVLADKQRQLEEVIRQNNVAQARAKDFDIERAAAKASIDTANARITALRDAEAARQLERTAAETELQTSQAENGQLRADIARLQRKQDAAAKELDEAREEVQRVVAEHSDAIDARDKMREERNQLQRQLDTLDREQQQERDELRQQIDRLQNANATAADLTTARRRIDTLESLLDTERKNASERSRQALDAIATLRSSSVNRINSVSQLDALRSELDAAIQQVSTQNENLVRAMERVLLQGADTGPAVRELNRLRSVLVGSNGGQLLSTEADGSSTWSFPERSDAIRVAELLHRAGFRTELQRSTETLLKINAYTVRQPRSAFSEKSIGGDWLFERCSRFFSDPTMPRRDAVHTSVRLIATFRQGTLSADGRVITFVEDDSRRRAADVSLLLNRLGIKHESSDRRIVILE